MRVFAVIPLGLALLLAACTGGEAGTATSETARPSDSTPTPTAPGGAWVSYSPQTGPVGTRVEIQGNVGQLAFGAGGSSQTQVVRVELWKLDDPSGVAYAEILGNLPYSDQGDFRGGVIIPAEVGPHQADPATPRFKVVPGEYSFRLHPVDVGPQPFVVTGG